MTKIPQIIHLVNSHADPWRDTARDWIVYEWSSRAIEDAVARWDFSPRLPPWKKEVIFRYIVLYEIGGIYLNKSFHLRVTPAVFQANNLMLVRGSSGAISDQVIATPPGDIGVLEILSRLRAYKPSVLARARKFAIMDFGGSWMLTDMMGAGHLGPVTIIAEETTGTTSSSGITIFGILLVAVVIFTILYLITIAILARKNHRIK